VIVGGGACGMVAALAAKEAGAEPLLIERDPVPRGSTALSAGLIPAAGTGWQAAAGIADDPATFAADIMRKARGEPDPAIVDLLATEATPTLAWLAERHGLPSRTGEELIDRLRVAAETAGIDMLLGRAVSALYAEPDGTVRGVAVMAPDGTEEAVGCGSLVLACNGYGGNRDLVRRHMPGIADALWFGHDGNRGEAVLWGEALGAATRHLGAYQGHGSVAHPEGILISWAVIGAGGFQVNAEGRRFWDESEGYSEAAQAVLAQPGGVAWSVFDARCAEIARQFGDFRAAEAMRVFRVADGPAALAEACGLPAPALVETFASVSAAKAGRKTDSFCRAFAGLADLQPPFWAVKVTGALFHTQGGLAVDRACRVRRASDGSSLPNLLAAGGAACGVSGSGDSGCLSGNGLLSAVVMGRVAGRTAALSLS
jgi:fumarate reductase flavoprotein subunit